MDLNRVTLIGRLAADPDPARFRSGQDGDRSWTVGTFPLAVNRRPKNGVEQPPNYFDIQVSNGTANAVLNHKVKGDQVAIDGELEVNVYDDSQGAKQYRVRVRANSVQFLGAPRSNGDAGSDAAALAAAEGTPAPATSTPAEDEDIPF